MYNVILLDLDNTILDFDTAEKDSFKKVVKAVGLNYTDELLQQYKRINKFLWSTLEQGKISKKIVLNTRFSELFKLYDMNVDGKEIEILFRSHLDDCSTLIPNAESTLLKLKKMGKEIYSASNGVYSTQIKRLTNAGIIDLFDGHFISDKIKYEKPSPHFYDFCFKNIPNIKNKSIIMVGDSPTSDIQGAVNVGIDSCFYQHDKDVECYYAKYTISNISQLLGLA
jgi:2-haloacid dehalogenase